ncbi:MAG: hypothetical protein H0W78_07390 [Planctomycetes bacterium]|nr:hypothetical protein [Planctomycetota bacterium]
MTVRLPLAALALIAGLLSTPALHAGEDRDVIVRKNGTKIAGFIESETTAGIVYRTIKGTGGANTAKLNEVQFPITYAGMDGGAWAKGQSERDAGNYETAAEFFNQLATTGTREWEKVYGSIAEGECWELARKYTDAAKAFNLVVQGFGGDPATKPPIPAHRLWLDAKYRLGMAYAQAKNADADKIAQELEALGKKEGLSAAESRANAIRAAKFAADGNLNKFTEFMKKASVRSFDEPDVWFHFKLFCAESLRQSFKKGKEAAAIYREILNGLAEDPARQAQISLGLGLTLVENDKESALIELLKLDVLPYGSPDQKCEARYNAGRLLWESAQAIKANSEAMKDEKKANFVKETERAARLVISAAADGPPKNPNVDLAKALLASFGPDPDAPKPKDEKKTAPPAKKEEPKKEPAKK